MREIRTLTSSDRGCEAKFSIQPLIRIPVSQRICAVLMKGTALCATMRTIEVISWEPSSAICLRKQIGNSKMIRCCNALRFSRRTLNMRLFQNGNFFLASDNRMIFLPSFQQGGDLSFLRMRSCMRCGVAQLWHLDRANSSVSPGVASACKRGGSVVWSLFCRPLPL